MNNKINELIAQFNKIVVKRWIPSVNKGLGSVGLTFEKELNKNLVFKIKKNLINELFEIIYKKITMK